MKILVRLEKRLNRILLAMLIGIIFACGAFLMQQTAEPIAFSHINPASIKYEAVCGIESVYNGINQVSISGYSIIKGIDSINTRITVVAVQKGGDVYAGYPLSADQRSYSELETTYGAGQGYSKAGFFANCYVSQIPHGYYNIGILTEAPDGGLAYELTTKDFVSGVYETDINILFFVIAWTVYALFAFLCLELLFKKKHTSIENGLSEGGIPGKHSFLSILNVIFLALFFWIFLNVTFANLNNYAKIETFKGLYSVWGAVLFFIVMYSVWQGADFSKKPSVRAKTLIVVGCIAFFMFQIIVCNSISGESRNFDANTIAKSALSYVQNGAVEFYPEYFVLYPINYSMLFTDIGLYKLAGGSQFYFQQLTYIVNSICLDISIALAYMCIKDLFGRRPAVVMLIPMCLLIGLNPMMTMFYNDILSMVFTVLIFFLYLKLRKTKKLGLRIVLLILIALSVYAGCQYKITSIIIVIAIALIELIYHIKEWKCIVGVLLSCVIVFGIVVTLNKNTKDYLNTYPLLKIDVKCNHNLGPFSTWLWVMTGFHYPYGTFDFDDWTFAKTRPIETRDAEMQSVIKQRLSDYGPVGYLKFLNNKADYAFGDGTFSVGIYSNYENNIPDNIFIKLFQDIFGSGGKWFSLFAYTLQGAWILCLFLIVCPLFFKNKKKADLDISILRISVAGLLVYLLLSENNPRQLLNQLPLFMILAASSLEPVMKGFKNSTVKTIEKLKK